MPRAPKVSLHVGSPIAALRAWGVLVVVAAFVSNVRAQSIERVSVADDGTPGNASSWSASVSDDGTRVAFTSGATNLVQGDSNGKNDVFVRDRVLGTTTRVSVSTAGVEGDADSGGARISANGNVVAFSSDADNLIANDTNKVTDVFTHVLSTGATKIVSVSNAGAAGNKRSYSPVVSSDGRYVAFVSDATNLVAHDTNKKSDVFLRDRTLGTTIRVSVSTSGAQANGDSSSPVISRDGRYVMFSSVATNLDPADSDTWSDVYVRDTVANTTTLVSLNSAGAKGDFDSWGTSISDDGRYVAMESTADNLAPGLKFYYYSSFVRDVVAGVTLCENVDSNGVIPPPPNNTAFHPCISGDGRFAAFDSASALLVDGDDNNCGDVFCRMDELGMTTVQSIRPDGVELNGTSANPFLSADGQFLVFESYGTNSGAGVVLTNQVYLRQRALDTAYWKGYGSGFPGTHGVPSISMSAAPQLNQDVSIDFDNSYRRWTVSLLLIGNSSDDVPTALGGDLLLDTIWSTLVATPPYGGSFDERVSPDELLIGDVLYAQVVEVDPGAAFGYSFTAGVEFGIGY